MVIVINCKGNIVDDTSSDENVKRARYRNKLGSRIREEMSKNEEREIVYECVLSTLGSVTYPDLL